MTEYVVKFTKESEKFLKRTDKITRRRVLEEIYKLAVNPFEYVGVTKLAGLENEYRIKVGKYRVLYEVDNGVLVITVLNIDSRGGIYKRI